MLRAAATSLSGGPSDTRSLALAHPISNLSISFDIDNTSPILRFHGAWEPDWSDTLRREVYTTQGPARASVELAVEGTGLVLYGARDPPSPSASAITVRDNAGRILQSARATDGTLVDVRNSSFKRVEVTIDDKSSGAYSVSGATIYTHLASNANTSDSVPKTRLLFIENGKAYEAFKWAGSWAHESGLADHEGEIVGESGASVHVPVPVGSSLVVVKGSVGPTRGELVVEWKPPVENERINTTAWFSALTMLYLCHLDPHTAHTLMLRADGAVGLRSVEFYSAESLPSTIILASNMQLAANESASQGTWDQNAAIHVSRILGGVVGGIGFLTLIAVLRACWIRKKRQQAEDEEARAAYTAYLGTRQTYHAYDWGGGDGVASTSASPAVGMSAGEGPESEASYTTTTTSHANQQPTSPTVSVTPAPQPLHTTGLYRAISSPQPIRSGLYRTTSPGQGSSILLSAMQPITPTASPGDTRPRTATERPESSIPGFAGKLDVPETPVRTHKRRVSFTSDERPRPSRIVMERVQEAVEDHPVPPSPIRRGSLSRFLEEPLSRRITHVGEPLARRISRATDQSEQDVWDDIGIAPPVSTAAVLEGRRASRSSTDKAVSVSEGRSRGSIDSTHS
ncbi:hypothetical protein CC85DRAFT_282877 [Cutaneotrichosporon oleaginosum]|uniref:Transmembrane protein n=1 Tax=Cutaneotrichosporon oleaginosum TaxID=879819 RepID=A0A0J0XV73_9TREE|nr:uncharacterized protein CC85DRAFT_282877 [Cutaneotrichosporon oleaginosum]KLT44956.1 hypothetical protein CC85DRAFT_282877 [Cutaneotrichosporon oleaginosum]TXT09645.1 hypothetical protein COLE_03579 [Cutaneotrichosporon oleaginosum]